MEAPNQTYSEQISGMTMILDYFSDTATKTLTGVSTGSIAAPTTTARQQFLVNPGQPPTQGQRQHRRHPEPADHRWQLPDRHHRRRCQRVSGRFAAERRFQHRPIDNPREAGCPTLAAGDLLRSAGASSVDFSYNNASGGTATVNFGASGIGVALTGGGTGYAINQSNMAITTECPQHRRWSSGHRARRHQRLGCGHRNLYGQLGQRLYPEPDHHHPRRNQCRDRRFYFNNPVTGIIGGFATFGGTDWADRNISTGNIRAYSGYTSDPGTNWTARREHQRHTGFRRISGWLQYSTSISTVRITNASSGSNTLALSATGTTLRAIASSRADKFEQIIMIPAGVETFGLDAGFQAGISLQQIQGDPAQPREVLGTIFSLRIRWSSLKLTSSCQCRLFSTLQWPRMYWAMVSAAALSQPLRLLM